MSQNTQTGQKKLVVLALALCLGLTTQACKSTMTGNAAGLKNDSLNPSALLIEPSFFPVVGPTDIIPQNRTITRNYYYGAAAFNQSLSIGSGAQVFQANWLHFGIWGSMRAGESIDGSDLQFAASAKDFLFDYLEQTLAWLPTGIREQSIESLRKDRELIKTLGKIIRQSLGDGNRRVADEILGLTDRFIRTLGCDKEFNASALNDFLATMEHQLPPDAPISEIWSLLLADIPSLSKGKTHKFGQDALAIAYSTYYRAKFERNPKIRSEMMYYANLLIAIHEQCVLQTYISGALGILDPAGSIYRKVATLIGMDIGVPPVGFHGVSRNGEGLTRYRLRSGFPSSNFATTLQTYSWPPLVELAKVTGLDKNSGRGATDWTDYKSRVYYIGGMMRTLQANPVISSYPFAGPHLEINQVCPNDT